MGVLPDLRVPHPYLRPGSAPCVGEQTQAQVQSPGDRCLVRAVSPGPGLHPVHALILWDHPPCVPRGGECSLGVGVHALPVLGEWKARGREAVLGEAPSPGDPLSWVPCMTPPAHLSL